MFSRYTFLICGRSVHVLPAAILLQIVATIGEPINGSCLRFYFLVRQSGTATVFADSRLLFLLFRNEIIDSLIGEGVCVHVQSGQYICIERGSILFPEVRFCLQPVRSPIFNQQMTLFRLCSLYLPSDNIARCGVNAQTRPTSNRHRPRPHGTELTPLNNASTRNTYLQKVCFTYGLLQNQIETGRNHYTTAARSNKHLANWICMNHELSQTYPRTFYQLFERLMNNMFFILLL